MKDIKIPSKQTNPSEIIEEENLLVVENVHNSQDVAVEQVNTDQTTEHAIISQNKKNKQKRIKRIVLSLITLSVFFFLTTVFSQYQLYTFKKTKINQVLVNGKVSTSPEQIIEAVSHHILLPTSTPQIAAVQDAEKLSGAQAFFKGTSNGDVVLVYETMVVIYRPSEDIVVAVGDIGAVPK